MGPNPWCFGGRSGECGLIVGCKSVTLMSGRYACLSEEIQSQFLASEELDHFAWCILIFHFGWGIVRFVLRGTT